MPYLVDGHNLIPKIPGLSLQQDDDEARLIDLLNDFCRSQRKEVEVYFDKAPPGQARAQKMGRVTARFVPQGRTADAAIRDRLGQLGGEARNWIVVSSDRAVQTFARQARAQIMGSPEFARLVFQYQGNADAPRQVDRALNREEIEDWLRIFRAGKGTKSN